MVKKIKSQRPEKVEEGKLIIGSGTYRVRLEHYRDRTILYVQSQGRYRGPSMLRPKSFIEEVPIDDGMGVHIGRLFTMDGIEAGTSPTVLSH